MNKDQIFDPIRGYYVSALPEEIVRQKLILQMVNQLGYPKSLIAVEKDLKLLPHLKNKEFVITKRRADIICFAKNIHPKFSVYPLLMIECKAVKLTDKTIDQIIGYNHFVEAYFISIANDSNIKTLWYNKKQKYYDSVNFIPKYDDLIKAVR